MIIPRKLHVAYHLRLAATLAARRIRTPSDILRYGRAATGYLRGHGIRGLAKALRDAHDGGALSISYADWIARYDTLDRADVAAMRRRIAKLREKPLISVVMPVRDTPEKPLRQTIESVLGQIYESWELCIADDASPEPHVGNLLRSYAARDPRIRIVLRSSRGGISEAAGSAFALASGSWAAILSPGDVLSPHALAEVAFEIARVPDAELIYSDEDKIDETGRLRFDPHFKPGFSRELFRSQNYLSHLTVHRAANIRAVGGWRKGFEGSEDYDLNLRIFERIDPARIRHIPKILYHARAASGSPAAEAGRESPAYEAGLRALAEHVARTGLRASVEPAPQGPYYRLRPAVPEPQPLVSLIIPTRDKVDLLRRCIGSIQARTTYAPYEILVIDNGSTETETLAYLAAIAGEPRVRVLRYDKPFNFSAINNFGVGQAAGALVGLINNDIEVISPDWLTEMVSWATQPDVGCVGAKLYYPNDTIQHAGVVLGVGGIANHAHLHQDRATFGYFGRAVVLNNYSAVTGACLLVRKSLFQEVGGLNEKDLAVAFNDVDFCLKVREAGYKNVWTPYAEMYHFESVSRGKDDNAEKRRRFDRETDYMLRTWRTALRSDPFYSPHLSIHLPDFSIPR